MSLLLVILVVFFGVCVQSLAGFGAALVAMGLLPGLLGIQTLTPLVAILAGTTELILVIYYRDTLNVGAVLPLILTSVIGIPLGMWALHGLPEGIFMIGLGIVLVGYAVYGLLNFKLPELHSPAWAYGFGFLAGLLGGAYNTSGPPVVIYGNCRRWQPLEFKSNLQGFFIVNSLLVITSHVLNHNITLEVLKTYLWALPAVALGVLAGTRLSRSIDVSTFRKIILWLLLIMGARLILSDLIGRWLG